MKKLISIVVILICYFSTSAFAATIISSGDVLDFASVAESCIGKTVYQLNLDKYDKYGNMLDWCGYFDAYCINHSGIHTAIGDIPSNFSGYAFDVVGWACGVKDAAVFYCFSPAHAKLLREWYNLNDTQLQECSTSSYRAKRGDIVQFAYGAWSNHNFRHVGIVTEDSDGQTITYVDGNGSDDNKVTKHSIKVVENGEAGKLSVYGVIHFNTCPHSQYDDMGVCLSCGQAFNWQAQITKQNVYYTKKDGTTVTLKVGVHRATGTTEIHSSPYNAASHVGMLREGYKYNVVEITKNAFGNPWFHIQADGVDGWEFYPYLEFEEAFPSDIRITIQKPDDIVVGKGFTVRGTITSSVPITEVHTWFVNVKDRKVAPTPARSVSRVYGTNIDIATQVDKDIFCNQVPVGSWQIAMIAFDENGNSNYGFSAPYFVLESVTPALSVWSQVDRTEVRAGESITVTYGANRAGNLYLHVVKDGVDDCHQVSDSGSAIYTLSAAGTYSVYVGVYSGGVSVYSDPVTVNVFDPPVITSLSIENITDDGFDVVVAGSATILKAGVWNDIFSRWKSAESGNATFHFSYSEFNWDGTYHISVTAGNASGSITVEAGDIFIPKIIKYGTLHVEGMLESSVSDTIPGRINVFVNGEMVAEGADTYSGVHPIGSEYRIELIDSPYGFDGVVRQAREDHGGLTGTLNASDWYVTLGFSTGLNWIEMESYDMPDHLEDYDVEFRNIYETTSQTSPGEGWTQIGLDSTQYEPVGSPYESDMELETSQTRHLVSFYYYHYCGASHGVNADHTIRNGYVHGDAITDVNSVTEVHRQEDDTDVGYYAYILDWKTGGRAYCRSGLTCDGSYGTHGDRAYYWYKRSTYQDYQLVNNYRWQKDSGWVDTRDYYATTTRVRYKRRFIPAESISLNANLIETAFNNRSVTLTASLYPADAYPGEVHWSSYDESVAVVNDGVVRFIRPGAVYIEASGGPDITASCLVIIHSDERMVIPKGVKVIEEDAFRDNTAIEELVLPEGLECIESGAFYGCVNISLITAPVSLVNISEDAFAGCMNASALCSEKSAMADYCREVTYVPKYYDLSVFPAMTQPDKPVNPVTSASSN